jgi:hypothetical protein
MNDPIIPTFEPLLIPEGAKQRKKKSKEPAVVIAKPEPEVPEPPKPPVTLIVQREGCEEFLSNLNKETNCLDAVAVILDRIDPHQLRAASRDLLDQSTIDTALSGILAACASEIRIGVNNFRRDYCQGRKHEQ